MTLADFLNEQRADQVTVQHAVRYAVTRLADYLPPEDMVAELESAADATSVGGALSSLSWDGALLLDTDLMLLAWLWSDPDTQPLVREAVAGAKDRLPVVEVSVIAAVALYGMYLAVTKGKKKTTKKITHKPDGSWDVLEETEYYPSAGQLGELTKLFKQLPPPE
ncbi:hypothetical protein J4573_39795 [Actinomadura barringtoniae]|uniref:Uncharacterized protein n=1 Tax=Actinomadura barringtoniae TaxID=1427535 RepID=A0A939T8M3_9ACTN|nr:hypothetical protein [Actinomadura barringtoniae]MBO2453294.1 hypothetical protein [Actinomadura barringtoniae]